MSVTPLPVPVRPVHIYEFVNISRRESLLAISADDEGPLRERLRSLRPVEASSWDLARDEVSVTLLGANLPPLSAREFVGLYLENMRGRTWRYRVWDAGR